MVVDSPNFYNYQMFKITIEISRGTGRMCVGKLFHSPGNSALDKEGCSASDFIAFKFGLAQLPVHHLV